MRFICLLLSIYVIVLSIKPCCADSDCCEKKAAKKEMAGKLPIKEKECQDCSPFFTCASSIGFIPANPFIANIKLISENTVKSHAFYRQPFVHEVSLAIWQPPRLG